MDGRVKSVPNPLGGERRNYQWRGLSVAYVVRGTGAPVVFLHSIHAAAWSAEWRRIFPALADGSASVPPNGYCCYALDLPGFGASDRPPLRYTAALYLDLLRDFLRDVVQEPAVLVGSSLGGTYAIAVAADPSVHVRAVCAIGPAGVTRLTQPGGVAGGCIQGLLRSAGIGAWLFSQLVTRRSIRFFLKDIYASRAALDDETVELFWVSANQPNARFGPAAFVGMALNHDIRQALTALPCPLLLVWGEQASQTPFREAAAVRALVPAAQFVTLPGGDLPHDEHPAGFLTALRSFLASLPPTGPAVAPA